MRIRATRKLASLSVLISLLLGTTMAGYAASQGAVALVTTSTFISKADATVKEADPSRNFGADSDVRAHISPTVRAYMRFSVSGLNGATVAGAKLRLYSNKSSSVSVNIKAVSNNTWGETTITFSNAPSMGSTLATSPSQYPSATWVSLDVSSYVHGDGTYNFGLTTSNTNPVVFASRESGSHAPQLVLTLGSGSTVTPTPTSSSQTDYQPSFPIRAAFYYPWFAEAWTQSGLYPYTNYTPSLGYYSSRDSTTIKKHIGMMQYAKIQAGIASWWGQGSQTDSKIAGLLSATSGTNFRWALYYEMESQGDPSVTRIQNDLTYIRDHYGNDPSFLRVNGKFVVFVYSAGNDGCGMADRWKRANTVGAYVVLKVFVGYANCASQPNNWHQYSPAKAASEQGNQSYSISPGFWQKGHSVVLSRDVTRWTNNVKDMVASGAQWQLITTFSEWGEGTAVEPAQEWASSSGNGKYLDVLHYNGNMP